METVFSSGSDPRLSTEDPRPAEIELRESLQMAVNDDWEELARKELGCEKETSCVLQLKWDWHNYCVEIRCQNTTSEDWEP
jgi:hypothetical protein